MFLKITDFTTITHFEIGKEKGKKITQKYPNIQE